MTKRKNSPRWFNLIDEVASSFGLLNSPKADFQTISVLNSVTTMLMSGKPLSDGQKKTFIDCIRKRTRHTNFDFVGPIILSADQLRDARRERKGRLIPLSAAKAISSTFPPADETGELLDAFQCYFRLISTQFPPDFLHISTKLGARPAELLEFWWRNEMKSNEINHETSMACPPDDMRLAGSPVSHDEVIPSHEPAAPAVLHAKIIIDNNHGREIGPPVRPAPRADQVVVSYFHNDPAKAPSANIEYYGERYALVFDTSDRAESKIMGVADQAWWDHIDQNLLKKLRGISRAEDKVGSVRRFVLSPFYAEKDTYGKAVLGSRANAFAVLEWDDNNNPAAAFVVDGDDIGQVCLQRNKSTNPKAPIYKGQMKGNQKLAA